MCQWRDEETGEICGSVKSLEFHEPFGEDHNGDGRMQQRILLCWYHHYIYHMGDITRGQPKKSKLTEDISYEIDKENDLAGWMKKYGLVKKNENGTMQNEIESQSASGPAI
uniref:HNH endonuclease n=1 Tax=viral metagenome TaxID=1070528 RepID=A0A6M3XJ80_9ZZZZ